MSGCYDYKCYYYCSNSYILRDSVKIKMTLFILLPGCTVRDLRLGINLADSSFTRSPSQTKQHLRQNNTSGDGRPSPEVEVGVEQRIILKEAGPRG